MYQLFNAQGCLKVIKVRYQKPFSTLKERRFFQQVSIILLVFGMLRLIKCFRYYKAMKMKYSLASSTTKEIPSSLDPKITPVKYGEMYNHSKTQELKSDRHHLICLNIIFYDTHNIMNIIYFSPFRALLLANFLLFFAFFEGIFQRNWTKGHRCKNNNPYYNHFWSRIYL